MRLRHVLVGMDFTDRSRIALDRARRIAAEHDVRVSVIHVAPPHAPSELLDHARVLLAEHAEEDDFTTIVAEGSTASQLTREAERCEVDLIVLGAHGEHPLRNILLGSTAESVIHTADVPVLVVKRPLPHAYSNVLLYVDETEGSFHAANAGLRLAPGARHTMVHVVAVVGETLLRLHGSTDEDIDELRAAHTALIRPKIESLRHRLVPGVAPAVLVPGVPHVDVVETATSWAADLVVTGTGSGSRVRDILVGSVAQHVMRRVRCDVLIVPTRSGCPGQ